MVKKYTVGSHISKEPDLVLEEQLLLSPGFWKGVNFTREEIIKGMMRTNWNDPEISSILKNHPKKGELPSAEDWIGDLKNIRYLTLEDGVEKEGLYADAYLYDPTFAKKVVYGKARLALSIDSPYRNSKYGATDLSFSRTATVYRAGCKDAYIQLSDTEDDLKMRFVSQDLTIQLDGEVTSISSQGSSIEEAEEAQKSKKEIQLEDEEKSNLDIIKKGETKRVMQNKKTDNSVQLDDAPKGTEPKVDNQPEPTPTPVEVKTEPVVEPKVEEPKVEEPKVESKVEPTPAPVTPVKEVEPVKEVVDNSKEIGDLSTKVDTFDSKLDKIADAILKLAKVKETPKVEEPKVEPKVEEPKTEDVKKPALPQTSAHIEETFSEGTENMTKIEQARQRLNSKK